MSKEADLVQMIADAALDENAIDLLILDVSELTVIADYFVICNGRSSVQIQSIAANVEKVLKEKEGILPLRRDGVQQGKWVILDYGSVILHVFAQEERDYYKLEKLWGDAKGIQVKES